MNMSHKVKYVTKAEIYPAFGCAVDGVALIRKDLKPAIKDFVLVHEMYHLNDTFHWGGWWGKEVRANVVAACKHPLGFLQAVFASINRDRIKFYIERFRKKG